jgi:hypothetical protein
LLHLRDPQGQAAESARRRKISGLRRLIFRILKRQLEEEEDLRLEAADLQDLETAAEKATVIYAQHELYTFYVLHAYNMFYVVCAIYAFFMHFIGPQPNFRQT